MFLSSGTSLGVARVLPSSAPPPQRGYDSILGIYSIIMQTKSIFLGILENVMPKPLRGSKKFPIFSSSLESPLGSACKWPGQSPKEASGTPISEV